MGAYGALPKWDVLLQALPMSSPWAILALISLTHIIGAAAQYGINTFAPFYQADLDLSRAQVGLFVTAFYTGMAGFSFAAGWLCDRLGVRAATLTGHLMAGACTLSAAMGQSFGWAFGSFLAAGLGYSFLNPASTKGVMIWFDRRRATAMGIKQTGVPTGGVLTALIGAPLALTLGWRAALAGLGMANVLFGLFFWILWSEPPREQAPGVSPSKAVWTASLNIKMVLVLSCGTALFLIGQMSLLTFLPLYLKESLGFTAYASSQWLAVLQGGAMLGRIGWGAISDRLFAGRRKIVLVLIGLISALLCVALSLLSPGIFFFLLAPLVFGAGFCLIGYQGVSYSLVGEIAGPVKTGRALGIMITVNAVGTIVGTPLFGYLVDTTDSYSLAWIALAGLMLAGAMNIALFVKEPTEEAGGVT